MSYPFIQAKQSTESTMQQQQQLDVALPME